MDSPAFNYPYFLLKTTWCLFSFFYVFISVPAFSFTLNLIVLFLWIPVLFPVFIAFYIYICITFFSSSFNSKSFLSILSISSVQILFKEYLLCVSSFFHSSCTLSDDWHIEWFDIFVLQFITSDNFTYLSSAPAIKIIINIKNFIIALWSSLHV